MTKDELIDKVTSNADFRRAVAIVFGQFIDGLHEDLPYVNAKLEVWLRDDDHSGAAAFASINFMMDAETIAAIKELDLLVDGE